MLEAALNFAELGFSVFPCAPGQKHPLKGSHGCLEATTDVDQIERWWTAYPTANIGLSCAGLLVVDLDVDDIGAANSWLHDEPDKLVQLSAAPLSLTPRGGRHYIFKAPAGSTCKNTQGKLAPKVDTRADGGYILAPPSILSGELLLSGVDTSYRWAESAIDVGPERLPEPPGWLIELLSDKAEAGQSIRLTQAAPSNPIPSGQANGALTSIGGHLRRAGLSQNEICAALLKVNGDRCNPPMDRSEVETIAWSVARYEADQVTTAVVEQHAAQDAGEEAVENEYGDDPGPLAASMLEVPGFISQVMAHTMATANYPDKHIAFAGAFALQSFLASRKIMDIQGNRSNSYIILLADTGAGKDQPRKVNKEILMKVGLIDCIGDAIASAEGLEDQLLQHPAMLFQIDEMGELLQSAKDGKDGRHRSIMAMLLKLYSDSDSIHSMRSKAGKESTGFIDQPGLNILGSTLPTIFYESLSKQALTDGTLGRCVVIQTGLRGNSTGAVRKPVPDDILEIARHWADFQPGGGRANLAVLHPEPLLIERTPDAEALLTDHNRHLDAEYKVAQAKHDTGKVAILARAHEKALRFSLAYAASVDHLAPIVTEEAARWACQFVDHTNRQMLYMAEAHMSENEFEAKRKRVLRLIKQQGTAGVTQTAICRQTRQMSNRERNDIIDSLKATGEVREETIETSGRPRTVLMA